MAEGHIWNCKIKDETEARRLGQSYYISSKQYVEDGMKIKIISKNKPDIICSQAEPSLEDAYMYITNLG